jgi:peroxiredoxin
VINDEVTHYTFIAEPGSNLKIDLNNKLLVKGSPLNDDYITYTEAGDALNNQIRVLNDSLVALMENNTLSPEEAENSFYSNLEALNATYCNTLENILAAHSDNVVGAIALNSYLSACEDDARIESVMASMSQYVLTHPIASKRVQLRISLQETAEGMPFKDFSVEQEDGTTISLSDYVGKGQYVLADFWASWCPPCRQSMPLLKALYNERHGKGLEILGLATRDKVKDSLRAIEEEEMPWPQILSDNSPAAKIYGVNGIPHLILFAPDGTIALRGYPDEEFLNKVKEMIIKQ